MEYIEIAAHILFIIFLITAFTTIGMTYYLGRRHVKEIDRLVYGYEFPNDSIFALFIRVPNYAGAFTFKWSAKRSGLSEVIKNFDDKFRKPFVFTFWSMILSLISLLLAIFLDKTFLGI